LYGVLPFAPVPAPEVLDHALQAVGALIQSLRR